MASFWHPPGHVLGSIFDGFLNDLGPPWEQRGIKIQDFCGSRFRKGEFFRKPIFRGTGGGGRGRSCGPYFSFKGALGSVAWGDSPVLHRPSCKEVTSVLDLWQGFWSSSGTPYASDPTILSDSRLHFSFKIRHRTNYPNKLRNLSKQCQTSEPTWVPK